MIEILTGDCREILKTMPSESVHCSVTSPPYFGLRDYGVGGQIGLEPTPNQYIAELVAVFREVRRVLRDDATLWLNLGDSYARSAAKGGSGPCGKNEDRWGYGVAQSAKTGSSDGVVGRANRPGTRNIDEGLKPKNLIGIPWRVAFALQADGWYLRQDIIWHKPNPMPESVTDRCTKAHEYIFLLSKSERYFWDVDAIREPHQNADRKGERRSYAPGSASNHRIDGGHEKQGGAFAGLPINPLGRNKRSVWTVPTLAFSEAHFATFPPPLIEPCILAGCPEGGTVLDPFGGAGTTGMVADRLRRSAVLIELNPEYSTMARSRIHNDAPLFVEVNHAAE